MCSLGYKSNNDSKDIHLKCKHMSHCSFLLRAFSGSNIPRYDTNNQSIFYYMPNHVRLQRNLLFWGVDCVTTVDG